MKSGGSLRKSSAIARCKFFEHLQQIREIPKLGDIAEPHQSRYLRERRGTSRTNSCHQLLTAMEVTLPHQLLVNLEKSCR